MSDVEKRLKEIEENVRMALKYQSWGNAAETLKQDIPWLLAEVKRLREALESAHHDLERIRDRDWTIEQARMAATSGAYIVDKALKGTDGAG